MVHALRRAPVCAGAEGVWAITGGASVAAATATNTRATTRRGMGFSSTTCISPKRSIVPLFRYATPSVEEELALRGSGRERCDGRHTAGRCTAREHLQELPAISGP